MTRIVKLGRKKLMVKRFRIRIVSGHSFFGTLDESLRRGFRVLNPKPGKTLRECEQYFLEK